MVMKYLESFFKINESNHLLHIKDRCYDLIDLGFDVKIGWTYSTRERVTDKTPKVEILITGDSSKYDQSWDEEVLPTIEIIRGLIRSEGFSSGSGFVGNEGGSIRTMYKIIFQY